jgi:hypothetical protein
MIYAKLKSLSQDFLASRNLGAAKPQWKKTKKPEDKKPEGPVHTYFISSDEDKP